MISIVLSGRNDDYFEDFKERLEIGLRLNRQNLLRYKIPSEIIFIEWNPIEGKPYLSDLLKKEFPDIRCYIVDPLLHRYVCENKYITFYEFFAKNIGARKAKGDFILFTNADIIIGRELFEYWSKDSLDPSFLYRADRVDIYKEAKKSLQENSDCFAILEDLKYCKIRHDPGPPPYTNGCGDMTLLSKKMIDEVGGYDETIRFATSRQDSRFVHRIHVKFEKTKLFGTVYHLDHIRQSDSLRFSKQSPLGPPYQPFANNFFMNFNYGFTNITTEEFQENYVYLRIHESLRDQAINKILPEPVLPPEYKLE